MGTAPRSSDIKCLRCEAFNIAENHVCGRCGASLPVIYNEEGGILKWQEDPYYGSVFKGAAKRKVSPLQRGMMFRLMIIALAILIALVIMGRR